MLLSAKAVKREAVPLLTAQEAAAKLEITRNAVYHLANKRDGLRAYKIGGCLRFKAEDVEAYRLRSAGNN